MRYALNTTPINGSARLYGKSTAILIEIGATGYSSKQKNARSTAALVDVDASGAMKQALGGRGTAPIEINADGLGRLGLKGYGQAADMIISARHGIPNPMPRPATIARGHPSRRIIVGADQRVVIVPADDRSVTVAPDNRTVTVSAEQRSI